MKNLANIASVVIMAAIIGFSHPVALAHQTRVMPVELEILAKSFGCEPLYDHYDLAINNAPPFVYYDYNPYLLGGGYGTIAAFHCAKPEKGGFRLVLVLAKFPSGYSSIPEKEGWASLGPREGEIIAALEFSLTSSRDEINASGMGLWPQRRVPLEMFMRWPGNEWLGDVEGFTEYPPIRGIAGDGISPVFYYSPDEGWLWFMPD